MRCQMDAKRLFAAVDISEQARKLAVEYINVLRNEHLNVRVGWAAPEKLHITLKFLGDVEAAQEEKVADALAEASAAIRPFELRIAGTGVFPGEREPRVLWLGVEDIEGGLARLHSRIENALAAAGFAKETRAFRPHLTIARIRDPRTAARLAQIHLSRPFSADQFTASHTTLYQSRLLPSGSEYTKLKVARLG